MFQIFEALKIILTKGQKKMEKLEIKKSSLIKCKNFLVSIGTHSTSEVAIIGGSSGEFVKLKQTKVSKKLKSIKRKFGSHICDHEQFFFCHMSEQDTLDLIAILKQ
jgi:hypothetical protein